MKTREQRLIDILFSVSLMIHNDPLFKDMTDDQVAEWIRHNLQELGFKTIPVGSSWGVLQES